MAKPTATRVAMWSGPRNISTALMRSFGNRPDTAVCDEPLYAHYLTARTVDHPAIDEVIAHHETDWTRVVETLLGPVPDGRAVFYQKHMAHHLLPEIDRGWIAALSNGFLIREPREMLISLVEHMRRPNLDDTGLPQQLALFHEVRRRTGRVPPVVDARDVLEHPEAVLRRLCDALGLPWNVGMLRWPSGRRATDGIWARHWYGAVERSTGFLPYRPKLDPVPAELTEVAAQADAIYRELHSHRLRLAATD